MKGAVDLFIMLAMFLQGIRKSNYVPANLIHVFVIIILIPLNI